jgi:hypothetical protein
MQKICIFIKINIILPYDYLVILINLKITQIHQKSRYALMEDVYNILTNNFQKHNGCRKIKNNP